jgi:hypothetical protein
MKIPAFTAEASLYKTSGHYRTGRHMVTPTAQTVGLISPAAREQEGEVIHIHSCPPGWTDYGGTCFPPPVTEPPVGGGGGEGTPPGGGPDDDGPGGGGDGEPYGTKKPPKGTHQCGFSENSWRNHFQASECVLDNQTAKKGERYRLYCGQDDKIYCCHIDRKNNYDCKEIQTTASQ